MEQAGETGVVCICGSLYLVGELRGLLAHGKLSRP